MYRITPGWSATADEVEARLQDNHFIECGASQEKSVGWIEPRGEANGPLLEVVAGQWILKLMVESRALPASVVNRKAQERVAQIEATTGRKPGKKETRDLKDDIRLELLPMAFTKQSRTLVWIDREANLLVMDASSQARADELVTLLVQTLPGLALTLVNTRVAPATAMAEWLVSGDRLLRYDMTLPGHMIPPLESVRAKTLNDTSTYIRAHEDWIESFYDWSAYTNHPAMNMGSLRNGSFQRSETAPPWVWEVFGQPGMIDTVLQEIVLGSKAPELAWQEAVAKIESAVGAWKASHPEWQGTQCSSSN